MSPESSSIYSHYILSLLLKTALTVCYSWSYFGHTSQKSEVRPHSLMLKIQCYTIVRWACYRLFFLILMTILCYPIISALNFDHASMFESDFHVFPALDPCFYLGSMVPVPDFSKLSCLCQPMAPQQPYRTSLRFFVSRSVYSRDYWLCCVNSPCHSHVYYYSVCTASDNCYSQWKSVKT